MAARKFYLWPMPHGDSVGLFCRFPDGQGCQGIADPELTAAEALAVQKAYLAKLRGQYLRLALLEDDAEAILRLIETAVAEEEYKKTLYKD